MIKKNRALFRQRLGYAETSYIFHKEFIVV